MHSALVAAGLFAVSALASPHGHVAHPALPLPTLPPVDDCPPCMTYAQAKQVADNFAGLISNYSNASANAVLSSNYSDYSDSVSELINSGCPTGPATLGTATFSTRAAFEAGQGSQPNIPFNLLNVWHTCDVVALRWRTNPTPNATESVTGIIVLETEYQKNAAQPFLISTTYSEFNSGAWLVDLGVFTPTCTAATKRDALALPHRIA